MVHVEWFGYALATDWVVLLGIAAVLFLLCAGIAWTIGKAASLRAGPLTISLGGGAVLFVLIVAGVLSAIYVVLSSG